MQKKGTLVPLDNNFRYALLLLLEHPNQILLLDIYSYTEWYKKLHLKWKKNFVKMRHIINWLFNDVFTTMV